jgi:hypothetical protein
MSKVNPTIEAPRPPGHWVDDEDCACGARYQDFKLGELGGKKNFARIRERLYHDYQHGKPYFLCRSLVLWYMRVMKLNEWYLEHAGCEFSGGGAG